MAQTGQNAGLMITRYHPRKILSALCILCLLATAFMYRPFLLVSGYTNIDMAAYQLPDGSFPILCLDGSGDGEPGPHSSHCPLCTLAETSILPSTSNVSYTVFFDVERFEKPASYPSRPFCLATGIGARGPPALV